MLIESHPKPINVLCEQDAQFCNVTSLSMYVQGGSNMTGTNCDLFTYKSSQSYLNHLLCMYMYVCIYIHIHTPWSRDFPEKLTGPQLETKVPGFYATRRFITAFTTACPYPEPDRSSIPNGSMGLWINKNSNHYSVKGWCTSICLNSIFTGSVRKWNFCVPWLSDRSIFLFSFIAENDTTNEY